MSDNVSQMHTPQGKKLVRRILLFSLILLLVLGGCALYFFRDSINTFRLTRTAATATPGSATGWRWRRSRA